MKSQNLQENGLRLYNIKQSTQTQKEKKKKGSSPSDVAYNVNTCKCRYTLTFSKKTQKGHYQVMRRARSYKQTHASGKTIQS